MRKSTLICTLALTSVAVVIVGVSQASLQERPRAASNVNAPSRPVSQPTAAKRATAAQPDGKMQVASNTGAAAEVPQSRPAWASRCASATRKTAPECVIEQAAILNKTGQLIASVSVRMPSNGGQPVMMIQVPVGLYLPAGINMQIDEQAPVQLVVQTCDLKGCYTGLQVSPEFLNTMKSGKRLAVTFQNISKQNITVPMTLAQFAETYQQIQ